MARRALDFAIAHPLTDSGFVTVVKRLQDQVTRGDTLGMQEGEGKVDESAAIARRKSLKESIRQQQLRRLVHLAKRAAKDHPEMARKFSVPAAGLANKPFVLAARSQLAAATAQAAILTPLGLGDTFFADLTAAIDQYDSSTENAHTGRVDHVGAGAVLLDIATDCVSDVEVIDTYYAAAFPNDKELQAAWDSAKNKRGPFLHREPAAPAPEPAPLPAPAPTPATDKAPGKEDDREVA
jgi:hypothetical protein